MGEVYPLLIPSACICSSYSIVGGKSIARQEEVLQETEKD